MTRKLDLFEFVVFAAALAAGTHRPALERARQFVGRVFLFESTLLHEPLINRVAAEIKWASARRDKEG